VWKTTSVHFNEPFRRDFRTGSLRGIQRGGFAVLSIETWTSTIPLSEHHRDAFSPQFVKGILRISDNVGLIVPNASSVSSAAWPQFSENSGQDVAEW
jgi:hypothetical protein